MPPRVTAMRIGSQLVPSNLPGNVATSAADGAGFATSPFACLPASVNGFCAGARPTLRQRTRSSAAAPRRVRKFMGVPFRGLVYFAAFRIAAPLAARVMLDSRIEAAKHFARRLGHVFELTDKRIGLADRGGLEVKEGDLVGEIPKRERCRE